ncbi:hypothetical protein PR048_001138 [Dryococelus australis]|uniref:Integrase catalytic domain-containing protein n=1 Tax=Dryococelus australis TaxID=614101 RepID=A0ABQ9IGI7_9NEOP|nr:hypothetical protein PR048_001138 [Dryococelus australis]
MPFGLASAPEIFQQIMCHTLHGIKGAECSMGDIFLHAESTNELDAVTETALTKTQQNYSQTQKDAFAILSACKKFHEYIWGNLDVTIETNHKPLEAIFKKPLQESPTRLHRIQFEILPYNPTIRYKKGSELYIADTLSRDSHEIPKTDARAVYEVQVVIQMSAQHIAQLKDAIHTSNELSALCQFILQGGPNMIQQVPDNLCKYWTFRDELAVHEDITFKGKKPSYHPLGSPPSCHSCTVLTNGFKEALSEETVPSRPWMHVASDLFHYKGKNFLFVADSYSGYFNFHVLTSPTSNEVIKILKAWFAQHGIPDELHTDRGPQYASHQFQKFKEEWNFQHRISSPHFPWSNSLVEWYIQEGKNLLAKCEEDQSDIWVTLLHHRNTPRGNLGSPVQ